MTKRNAQFDAHVVTHNAHVASNVVAMRDDECARYEFDCAMREHDELIAQRNATTTITTKLTKSQRAKLRAYFKMNNVETTKHARYATRTIPLDAMKFANIA